MKSTLHDPSVWRGIWTALVTPLNPDCSVDEKSLENLIEHQISLGVKGLVIAGSTGEGSLLSAKSFEQLLRASKRTVGKRIPLVSGLGIGGTESTIEKAKLAKDLGFDGVLASPPAYVKAPQRGLLDHFLKVADVGLPVCLYEIASRAAVSIHVQTLKNLFSDNSPAAKNIVAVKDASADLQRASATFGICGESWALLSGDDGTFIPFLAAGGQGLITVVGHFCPKRLNQAMAAFKNGDSGLAKKIQSELLPVIDSCFAESNPIPTKAYLKDLGMISSETLLSPLCPMDRGVFEKNIPIVRKFFERI